MAKRKPTIRAEMARTPSEHAAGLMGRKSLPKDAGMLFDFGSDRELSFWMANTYIPLQIAFIDSKGRIGQIESMVPMSTRPVRSAERYRYALEVNDGWFDDNEVSVGDFVSMPRMSTNLALSNSFGLRAVIGQSSPPPGFQLPGGPVQVPPGQNPQPNPSAVILESWKDLFKAADECGVPLLIEWTTKSGLKMPLTAVSPPYTFENSAEPKRHDGLLVAWSDRDGHFISPIIDNITGVFDLDGKPVVSSDQVRAMGSAAQPSMEDLYLAEGERERVDELNH